MRYLTLALLIPVCQSLWPLPKVYTHGNQLVWLSSNVKLAYHAQPMVPAAVYSSQVLSDATSAANNSEVVVTAIKNFYSVVSSQAFIPWRFHPRGSSFNPASNTTGATITTISLVQTAQKASISPLNETYTLSVSQNGSVTITAPEPQGLAYGLITFGQMFFKAMQGGLYTQLAPVYVADGPKFQHRGLNLDVSRSYYEVTDITRTIDALAFNKFNRLHLHITDAQSWPLSVPSIPELAGKGAFAPGLVYTPSDLQYIQAYGALRAVMVYLEIDMPGHTSSIFYSHPELITAFNRQPDWPTYSGEPPSGSLRLNDSNVESFLTKMWEDLLPRVSKLSNMFHTGGDEVNYNTYLLDSGVRSNASSVIKPLLQAFIDNAHAHVRAQNLTPVVWEEMLLSYNLSLPSDVIVQTWLSDAAVLETVQRGHRALVGNYEYWYLDCGKGQWLDFTPGGSSKSFWPYLDYCDPHKNWRLIYSFDPLRGIPAHLQHLVIGGEAHMWGEQTDGVNLDTSLWPRLSAAGEVLWRGQPSGGMNLSQLEASPRLADMRERLVGLGVRAEPINMPFCTMYPGNCVL